MKTILDIATKIEENLTRGVSLYFTVYSVDGKKVKIRTATHSANRQNNDEDIKTLSFVTDRTAQRKSGYNRMINEWLVGEDGYTDTYQTIEEVLEWKDIADNQEEAYDIYLNNL